MFGRHLRCRAKHKLSPYGYNSFSTTRTETSTSEWLSAVWLNGPANLYLNATSGRKPCPASSVNRPIGSTPCTGQQTLGNYENRTPYAGKMLSRFFLNLVSKPDSKTLTDGRRLDSICIDRHLNDFGFVRSMSLTGSSS